MKLQMSPKTTIVDVTPDIIADYPQIICYINPKHEFYHLKIEWLKKRYKEGLKIKLLYLDDRYISTTRFLNIMKKEFPKTGKPDKRA
ncbi:hypothetical protein ACFL5Z_11820 [Planctomycetota bacterium]